MGIFKTDPLCASYNINYYIDSLFSFFYSFKEKEFISQIQKKDPNHEKVDIALYCPSCFVPL